MQTNFKMNIFQKVYHAVFPTYIHALRKHLNGCLSMLELGCGKSSPVGYVKKTGYWVGVDVHKPAIQKSRKLGIYDRHVLGDVLKVDFKENEFECVIALDLLEHVTKKDGLKLLKKMEHIASKKVIIFTPNGFLPQRSIDGNDFQEHLSGWTADEMRALGFEVYGINGWKSLRGERTVIKWWPKPLWQLVSTLSEPFTYKVPSQAFQLFCVKTIRTKNRRTVRSSPNHKRVRTGKSGQ